MMCYNINLIVKIKLKFRGLRNLDRNNYNTKQRDEIVEFFSRHRGSCFTARDIIVSGATYVTLMQRNYDALSNVLRGE